MQHHKTVQMCVSAECDTTTATKLPTISWGQQRLFQRHLKLFEEPENIGFADLGNQNLRTSPVAPRQPWKANITFSNGNGFLPPNREFFPRRKDHTKVTKELSQRGPDPFAQRSTIAKI